MVRVQRKANGVSKGSFESMVNTRQRTQATQKLYETIETAIAAIIGNSGIWDEAENFCHGIEQGDFSNRKIIQERT